MKKILLVLLMALGLAACESFRTKNTDVRDQVERDLKQAGDIRARPAQPDAVSQALLPPMTVEMPKAGARAVEARFDLAVNNAPANQVFMALVSGTRYSMLVHPDIKETISVNLKDVTLNEALEAIRELYGYEYKLQGTRIYIQPVTIQTRLFQVNYLAGRRVGRADVRVTSGSIQNQAGAVPGQQAAVAGGVAPVVSPSPGTGGTAQSVESSRVTTTSNNDFWVEISDSIISIIGKEGGRNIVVNPTAGVIVVRATPSELRSVELYLRAMSLVVERQVMLEAKIIEVALSDQYATGINWAAFHAGGTRIGSGVTTPGTILRTDGTLATSIGRGPDGSLRPNAALTIDPAASTPQSPDPLTGIAGSVGSLTSLMTSGANVPASVFGLAFQTSNFAALLAFLESQGTVHVLSSPRIATLNNQKAVIKVGTDEFFVTNVSTTTTASGTATTVSPTITVAPFFSGIALDVTPQISDDDQITLHIHPSVSLVTDKTKTLNLGTLGTITLPLASSNINESDTIVRVQDGSIAAIGGLMKQDQTNVASGLPGTTDSVLGNLFGSRSRQLNKSELVILLKTTVIKGEAAWQQQGREVAERIQNLRRPDPPPPAAK